MAKQRQQQQAVGPSLAMSGDTAHDGHARDEIAEFLKARVVAPSEASWRLSENPLHIQHPPTCRLDMDLPGHQHVRFFATSKVSASTVASRPTTMLEGFFSLCNDPKDTLARTLLYREVPQHYVWHKEKPPHHWAPRKPSSEKAVGRMPSAQPCK
jgi:hypothetical protein